MLASRVTASSLKSAYTTRRAETGSYSVAQTYRRGLALTVEATSCNSC